MILLYFSIKSRLLYIGLQAQLLGNFHYRPDIEKAGVRTVRKGEKADICVVNTCSVTEVADKKCRQAIHKLIKQNPGAFVIVTGCYAQLKPEQVASMEGVDLVLGAEQKGHLLDYLTSLDKKTKVQAIPLKQVIYIHSLLLVHEETGHAISSKSKTDAITFVLIAPYPLLVDVAVTDESRTSWHKHAAPQKKEAKKSSLRE